MSYPAANTWPNHINKRHAMHAEAMTFHKGSLIIFRTFVKTMAFRYGQNLEVDIFVTCVSGFIPVCSSIHFSLVRLRFVQVGFICVWFDLFLRRLICF